MVLKPQTVFNLMRAAVVLLCLGGLWFLFGGLPAGKAGYPWAMGLLAVSFAIGAAAKRFKAKHLL